jgi:hypothetical protein
VRGSIKKKRSTTLSGIHFRHPTRFQSYNPPHRLPTSTAKTGGTRSNEDEQEEELAMFYSANGDTRPLCVIAATARA